MRYYNDPVRNPSSFVHCKFSGWYAISYQSLSSVSRGNDSFTPRIELVLDFIAVKWRLPSVNQLLKKVHLNNNLDIYILMPIRLIAEIRVL